MDSSQHGQFVVERDGDVRGERRFSVYFGPRRACCVASSRPADDVEERLRQVIMDAAGVLVALGKMASVTDATNRGAAGTVAARLALMLLGNRDDDGAVRLTQDELAHRLGCSRVHVANIIRDWRSRRLVSTGYRIITVCDGPALAAEART